MFIHLLTVSVNSQFGYAEQKGAPVFGRTDPSKYNEAKNVHEGAGSIFFMKLLGTESFESNIFNIHRGIIPPKCGIGEHLHRNSEDMYFVFNTPAEFTINGHTALLPAGSSVLCPLGSSHGIYNYSDEPLEWLNISVSVEKGKGGTLDYGEDLSSQKVKSPAPFKWAQFDRSLLNPAAQAHEGKGTVYFRTLWNEESFKTKWLRVGHILLPPDTSIGYHKHTAIEIVYYIMSGTGRMTVNDHTWDVIPGDAIPCTLHDSHGLYNNSNEPLDIFVFMVSMEKDVLDATDWGDDLTDR